MIHADKVMDGKGSPEKHAFTLNVIYKHSCYYFYNKQTNMIFSVSVVCFSFRWFCMSEVNWEAKNEMHIKAYCLGVLRSRSGQKFLTQLS